MKKLWREKLAKRIIAIVLILTTILPYFPISVFAVDLEENDNFIELTADWVNQKNEGYTSDTLGINYSLSFNSVNTGFQDVQLIIETDASEVPNAKDEVKCDLETVSGNGYTIINYGNVNTGVTQNGRVGIKFGNEDAILNRKVTLTLKGKCKDPATKEDIEFTRTKTLSARITPSTQVTSFNTSLGWGTNGNLKPSFNSVTVDLGKNQYGHTLGYYTTSIEATYPLRVTTKDKTQKTDLEIKINRSYNNQAKLGEGYVIDWDGLDSDFNLVNETTDSSDGSKIYTFSKGTDSDTYIDENTFSVNKVYNIKITYTVPNNNLQNYPNADKYTNLDFKADMTTTGFEITKAFEQEASIIKKTNNMKLDSNKGVSLNNLTPEADAWLSFQYSDATINNQVITNSVIQSLKTDRTANLRTSIVATYTGGNITSSAESALKFLSPTLTYIDRNGKVRTIYLTNEQLTLNSIQETKAFEQMENVLINNNSQTEDIEFSGEQNVSEKMNLFDLKMKNYLTTVDDYYGLKGEGHGFRDYNAGRIYLNYTLNVDELGLDNSEIDNILRITFKMKDTGDRYFVGEDTISVEKTITETENIYSYSELEIANEEQGTTFDTTFQNFYNGGYEEKTLKLRMYQNYHDLHREEFDFVTNERYVNYVRNENPVFYVSMPSDFQYKMSAKYLKIESTDDSIEIDNIKVLPINGENYLVISCLGTYDSRIKDEIDISVTYSRKLLSKDIKDCEIKMFMLTENQNYIQKQKNLLELDYNGDIQDEIHYDVKRFNIVGFNEINTKTIVENDIKYIIDVSDEKLDDGEIDKPIAVETNKQIIMESSLSTTSDELDNIVLYSRLPFANNNYIENSNQKIYNKTGEQITLTDIDIIGVYIGDRPTKNYTLYYSTDPDAGTDSATFVEYEPGVSDLTNAKNFKLVLGTNETLKANKTLKLKYTATMPNATGTVGAETAATYNNKSTNTGKTLYSPAIYVRNGIATGTLKIQKKYKYYNAGKKPEGATLENIRFKLQYYDEIAGEKKFVKDAQDNDIFAETNEEGIATFSNIPVGEYYVYEDTTVPGYKGMEGPGYVYIGQDEEVEYLAENEPLKGKIIINKTWADTNDQQGSVQFTVTRQPVQDEIIDFKSRIVYTDAETGIAEVPNLPYGSYVVTESSTKSGWVATNSPQTVTLSSAEESVSFENEPGTGFLKIIKTVPEGESVNELTFHIVGRGQMSYINKDGVEVNNNREYTIKVSDPEPSGVSIFKENNNTKVTITLGDTPFGYYTVEEVDIPTLGDTGVEKYSPAKGSAIVGENNSTYYTAEEINLTNNYKSGYLEIQKTAKLKVGDDYVDIGDLSGFKVEVKGTSFYGNEIDKIIELDENGYAKARIELGTYTLTEVPIDGYTAYYGTDNQAGTEPVSVTIEQGVTTRQNLYNEHTGVGYVRVEKNLEGASSPEDVVAAGIKFRVYGRNVAGQIVNSEIPINKIDEVRNVAYGISEPISVGGDYELQEIESTIPDYYEGMEPEEIQITTQNTTSNPVLRTVDNIRTKGNLEIVTTTDPEGGPLKGITYKVTEITINNDGSYNKIGSTVNVAGSNDDFDASFAKLEDIYAGYYLVEQDVIPAGWNKDVSQIVEVPSYSTGYANFEITEKKKLKTNKVTINKVILNSNNQVASASDIAEAKLDANEVFEVKVTNIVTGEVYYGFTSTSKPAVIQGLDEGTYKIEEVYKPKYNLDGYYNMVEVAPNPIAGETTNIENEIVEQKISATEGEYLFTITANGNKLNDVNLVVKNKINKDFGFGGQDAINNLSKNEVTEDVNYVTKTIIYVVDENNDAISGAKFRLINSENQVVSLDKYGTEYEINDKRLIIKGLESGTYTLQCTQYPSGYLKPEDKQVVVYDNATKVTRVEIQRNIPRGGMVLSTTYTTESGKTKYLPRSKYKIVNKATGELVKFTKTATGDYKKSNLEDAVEVVVVKSGTVELEGIETGDYEVGIVDVTKGFGLLKNTVEDVTVTDARVDGETVDTEKFENVNVEVGNNGIIDIDVGQNTTMYLTKSGELYLKGYSADGAFGNGSSSSKLSSQFTKIEFPIENVKIEKFVHDYNATRAIDSEGRIWTWGYDNKNLLTINLYNTIGVTCVTESGELKDEYYNNNTRFVDIQGNSNSTMLLDNKGRVWVAGDYLGDGSNSSSATPTVVQYFVDNNITVAKLAKIRAEGSNSNLGIIDSEGRVWTWGTYGRVIGNTYTDSEYTPICISQLSSRNQYAPLSARNVEELLITRNIAIALDSNGEVWLWGENRIRNSIVPVNLPIGLFGNAKIVKMACDSNDSQTAVCAFIDEFGRVWTLGSGAYGSLGSGSSEFIGIPVCISDDDSEALHGINMKEIEISYGDSYGRHQIVSLDSNNNMWIWGVDSSNGQYTSIGSYNNYISTPKLVKAMYNEHFEYNLMFNKVVTSEESLDNKFAIDNYGQVWVWGRNYNSSLGIKTYNNNEVELPTKLDIPGNTKVIKVSSDGNNTIFLTNDSRVFISGNKIDGSGNSTYDNVVLAEITNNFDISSDAEIIDVYCGNYTYYAITSDGKLYSWAADYYSGLGRTGSNNEIKQVIDSNLLLNNDKVIKISQDYYDNYLILTEKGDIYSFTGNNQPKLVSSSVKFVDIMNGYLLDENGKVWYYDGTYLRNIITPLNSIFGNYLADENYKIEKLYFMKHSTSVILKDNNGKLFKCEGIKISELDVHVKDVADIYGDLLVDKYGQIWKWDENGAECISYATGASTKVNQTVVNIPVENSLYGVKFAQLINDRFAIDENNNIWYFTISGKATNLTQAESGKENPLANKQVARVINDKYIETTDREIWYVGGSTPAYLMKGAPEGAEYVYEYYDRLGYEYYIALDSNGKIWTCGVDTHGNLGNGAYTTNQVPVCLNDIEGSDLNNAENNNSNFRITKVQKDGFSGVVAIDNTGKVWQWGSDNLVANSNVPICLTDVSGTTLYSSYYSSNVKMADFSYSYIDSSSKAYLKDENGTIWTLSYSNNEGSVVDYYKDNASGDLLSDYEYDSNLRIVKAVEDTYGNAKMLLGNNGKVYYFDNSDGKYKAVSGVTDVTDMYITYEESYISGIYYYYNSNVYAVSNNKLYKLSVSGTMNRNNGSRTTNVTTSNNDISTLNKIVDSGNVFNGTTSVYTIYNGKLVRLDNISSTIFDSSFSNKEVTDIERINDTMFALDEDNTLYAWFGITSYESPMPFTTYDEIIQTIYGEANNDTRKEFVRNLKATKPDSTESTWFVNGNKVYLVKFDNNELKCTEVSYTDKYLKGIGNITEVVGEYEVKTEDGKTYMISPVGVDSYKVVETDTTTPYTTADADPNVTLDGVNVVKQTAHKALDDQGNLYVWDEYTGLTKETTGFVKVNEVQYDVDPIYSSGNGWTIITTSY